MPQSWEITGMILLCWSLETWNLVFWQAALICLGQCKLLQDSSIRVWSLHCTFWPVQKTCLPLLLQEAWPCNCVQAHRPWSARCGFLNVTSSWISTSDLKPFICYLKPIPALCQGAAHGARAMGRFLLAWWHWSANIDEVLSWNRPRLGVRPSKWYSRLIRSQFC